MIVDTFYGLQYQRCLLKNININININIPHEQTPTFSTLTILENMAAQIKPLWTSAVTKPASADTNILSERELFCI